MGRALRVAAVSAITSTDRWTCPHLGCGHTEVLQVVTTEKRARARLRRVQEDHGRVHAGQERRSTLRSMRGTR